MIHTPRKSDTPSFKYTEIRFNIDDTEFSIHYSYKFNTVDGIPLISPEEAGCPQKPTLHTHPYCEMFFPNSEEFTVMLEDGEEHVAPTDVILISPGTRHTASYAGGARAFCIIFSFAKNRMYAKGGLYDLLSSMIRAPYLHIRDLRPFADTMNTLYHHLDRGSTLMVSRYFYDMLTDVLSRVAELPHMLPEDMIPDTDIRRQRSIEALIDRHYHENMTLEFLAGKLGLSVRQTSRTVKAKTGRTLGELVLERRMQAAITLLEETELSISEISGRVGYNSQTCFYNAVKKHFGCLPTEIRKKKSTRKAKKELTR